MEAISLSKISNYPDEFVDNQLLVSGLLTYKAHADYFYVKNLAKEIDFELKIEAQPIISEMFEELPPLIGGTYLYFEEVIIQGILRIQNNTEFRLEEISLIEVKTKDREQEYKIKF